MLARFVPVTAMTRPCLLCRKGRLDGTGVNRTWMLPATKSVAASVVLLYGTMTMLTLPAD